MFQGASRLVGFPSSGFTGSHCASVSPSKQLVNNGGNAIRLSLMRQRRNKTEGSKWNKLHLHQPVHKPDGATLEHNKGISKSFVAMLQPFLSNRDPEIPMRPLTQHEAVKKQLKDIQAKYAAMPVEGADDKERMLGIHALNLMAAHEMAQVKGDQKLVDEAVRKQTAFFRECMSPEDRQRVLELLVRQKESRREKIRTAAGSLAKLKSARLLKKRLSPADRQRVLEILVAQGDRFQQKVDDAADVAKHWQLARQ